MRSAEQAFAWSHAAALSGKGPIIVNYVLHCARILRDAYEKSRRLWVAGTSLDRGRIDAMVDPLMPVTALSPVTGYDKASKIAHSASADGWSRSWRHPPGRHERARCVSSSTISS